MNFGEPAEPNRNAVLDYLERIFFTNARLENAETDEERHERARDLAKRRVSDLLEEYEVIDGSPLNSQARSQAVALEKKLQDRGHNVRTYLGLQFSEPFIEDAASRAREEGADELIGLPIYPLCGPSTSVQALEDLSDALAESDWDVPVSELVDWHKHPTYTRMRVDNIRTYLDTNELSLSDPETTLLFSAHGTPQHYLEEGSRYQRYVEDFCATVAGHLGVEEYELGYQNHENRDIPWTEPEVEELVKTIETESVVVEPVSFMHEQSETLSELDVELREAALEKGLDFHRVPIPHDDGRFPTLLADLLEPFLTSIDPEYYNLRPCLCREKQGARCLNATRNHEIEGDLDFDVEFTTSPPK